MHTTKKTISEFLNGGGEMGMLIRTMDWSNSSLGSPDGWPQSLRTSVSICLNSRFPLLIWWGNNLVKIYNDAYREIIAAKHPRAMGANGADVWPEIWHIVGPMLEGVLLTGEATWSEDQLFILERNGYPEECYFTFSYSAIHDESGGVGGVFCAVTETTKKVLRVRHLAKQLSSLFIQAPVAICILRGPNYVIELINEKMAAMWDRKMEDVLNKPVFDVLTELRNQGFKELLDNVYKKGERFVAEELPINLKRNGEIENAFVKFIYEPLREEDGTISGVMALAHEITEQVMARKKIEESEAFNRTVLESSPDCVKIINEEGKLLFMNTNGMCNLEIDDFTPYKNKQWWEIWPVESQQMVKDAVAKAIKGEKAHFQAFAHTAKGTPKWWDVIVMPLDLADGSTKAPQIISVSRDITEQKQEAIKLEESELRYHNLIHTSTSLILILKGADLVIEVVNDAMIESLGKGKEITGKPLLEVVPEFIEQGLGNLLRQVYETGQPGNGYERPVYVQRKGKIELTYLTFSNQAQKNLDGEITGVVVIANEVTPQAELNIKIKESEQRFRTLADQIPMFAFIIEPNEEATISYWNKPWLNYTGQTLEEAIGRGWYGIIHPDDLPWVMDIYVPAFKNRLPYYLPAIRIKRHDGEYKWHLIKSNPRFLPNGEFIGYIGVGFDIHESKLATDALKESEAHFRLMADLMPAKISNADPAGDVTYFNKSWLEYAGFDFEDLRDFGYYQIIHPDDLEEFKSRLQNAGATGTVLEMEMRILDKAGDYKWHLNLASPVKDDNGQIKMWVGVTTEIQQQKEYTEKLEDAVKERTRELQKANDEIQKRSADLIAANSQLVFQSNEKEKRAAELSIANKALLFQNEEKEKRALELLAANKELEAFTYISSHDLQEPLRKINTFITLLFEKENQYLSDKGKDYLNRISNASKRMQTLIQDLLAYSSISDKELNFENTDLNNIITEVINDRSDIILEKNAIITVNSIGKVNINRSQFRQLTDNLIGNALKFSKPDIALKLNITSKIESGKKLKEISLSPEKNYCHICFSDNGIGFDPQYKDRIFEVFQRLYGKDEYEGTGIGLAIVKKIVENHGGVITAAGVINEGARFDIYLPV